MLQFLSTLQTVSSRLNRARMFFAALGGVLLLSGMAHASLIPALVGDPVPLGGGQFQYNYNIVLSADERVDPNATNGVTCPGQNNSNTQCNPAGTFVTFYDIPGLVSVNSPVPFWSNDIQLLGATPNSINGAAFDSPVLPNVIFAYQGEVLSGPRTFTGFSIVTTASGVNPVGNFTSQSTNNSGTSTDGTSDQVIGSVPLPIPVGITAATAAIGGRIMTSNGKGVRGVKVTITGTSSGVSQSVLSGDSGNYSFPDMETGEAYIITVTSKQYTFAQSTQLQMVLDDRNDINFIAGVARRFN